MSRGWDQAAVDRAKKRMSGVVQQNMERFKSDVLAPSKRKKRSHPESQLQRQCVAWFRIYYSNHLIFAIPNGAKRGPALAAIMKAEGVTAGVPDLFVAALGIHDGRVVPGLFIEMKYDKGKSTPTQKHIQSRLANAGYVVTECRTLPEFQSIIDNYFHPKS
jgi:hypothetical protein